jgi:heme/copper-type cytochrome/quinol oxidase subunit 3
LLAPLVFPPCLADLEGIIQAGDGNAFLIAGLCIFNCRFMYFYYAENTATIIKQIVETIITYLPLQITLANSIKLISSSITDHLLNGNLYFI